MSDSRVGLWMIGACGGVGSTTALGMAALATNCTPPVGLVTCLPEFAKIPFDAPSRFVVGGHDIRQSSLARSVVELHARSNVFTEELLQTCTPLLNQWSQLIRPGVVFHPDAMTTALADRPDVQIAGTPQEAIDRIQSDLREFQKRQNLDQLVVVNVASTEPPFTVGEEHETLAGLQAVLGRTTPTPLPTSSLYAYAAIDAGFPYVNITPSLGASIPALIELAHLRKVPIGGQDLKTGETLMKSILAPMFAQRNLRVLSWVGHNILGNRDGLVLNDPYHKASKVKSKDALVAEILGYRPQSHVSIEYIESLDDWKTAWDHIHYEGFLGTKMMLQFTWQGCDSILAAPLVIDLVRLSLLAQRRGEEGVMAAWASFFKSPMNVNIHDFTKQFAMLQQYLATE
jgi:myo-inositol-1-phosphate synthase